MAIYKMSLLIVAKTIEESSERNKTESQAKLHIVSKTNS